MKKVLYFLYFLCFFSSCSDISSQYSSEFSSSRFTSYVVSSDFNGYVIIYEDTLTHNKYLFIKRGYGAGLCPFNE